MNTETSPTEQQRIVAQAAASYTPPEPQRYTMLMPHRESIATLREKGASFRAIAEILDDVNVNVSLDTLSRFFREVIEQRSARNKARRRPFIRPLPEQEEAPLPRPTPAPAQADNPPSSKNAKAAEPGMPSRSKGPRIADPSSI